VALGGAFDVRVVAGSETGERLWQHFYFRGRLKKRAARKESGAHELMFDALKNNYLNEEITLEHGSRMQRATPEGQALDDIRGKNRIAFSLCDAELLSGGVSFTLQRSSSGQAPSPKLGRTSPLARHQSGLYKRRSFAVNSLRAEELKLFRGSPTNT